MLLHELKCLSYTLDPHYAACRLFREHQMILLRSFLAVAAFHVGRVVTVHQAQIDSGRLLHASQSIAILPASHKTFETNYRYIVSDNGPMPKNRLDTAIIGLAAVSLSAVVSTATAVVDADSAGRPRNCFSASACRITTLAATRATAMAKTSTPAPEGED